MPVENSDVMVCDSGRSRTFPNPLHSINMLILRIRAWRSGAILPGYGSQLQDYSGFLLPYLRHSGFIAFTYPPG